MSTFEQDEKVRENVFGCLGVIIVITMIYFIVKVFLFTYTPPEEPTKEIPKTIIVD